MASCRSQNCARLFLLVLLLLTAAWIGGCDARGASSSVDSWHHPPPDDAHWWGWPQLKADQIFLIPEANESLAVRLLEEKACVELTAELAPKLLERPPPAQNGKKLYLVRAVALNRAYGRFGVYLSGRRVVIVHGNLGRHPLPMTRKPIVVELAESPSEVFITCSMAK